MVAMMLQFSVKAEDHGDPPLSSQLPLVTIIIDDGNNHPAVFDANNTDYHFEVQEDESGRVIGIVQATDEDDVRFTCYSLCENIS
jgi:hypothetical protein